MGLAQKIIGYVTGNGAEVDAGNNLKTTTPQATQRLGGVAPDTNNIGAVATFFEHDGGAYTGVRDLRSPSVTENGNLIVAPRTTQWHGMFAGSAQNTGQWKHTFTTMTATQTGDGFINLNANSTATTATGCMMQTWKYFSFFDQATFSPVFQVSATVGNPVSNQVLEFGFGATTATAAPTDGVYLRYTTAGLYGYIKFGGNAEVASAQLLPANALTLNQTYDFQIIIDERSVDFYMGGDELGAIDIPLGQSNVCQQLAAPIFFVQRNSGAVSGTQMIAKISCTSVMQDDLSTNKPWAHQLAGSGYAYQGLEGGTMGPNCIYTNAAVGAAAALTNTTAAAPNVGLGGVALVLPTLTAGTDGILFSFLNPAGTTTVPGRTLYVTGVGISSGVQVALTGAPLNLVFGAAFGHTALSLATADSATFTNNTTKSPRRLPLGIQSYVVTAAAGVSAPDIVRSFDSPLVVNPGEYFAITMRNLGTVTSAGALAIAAGIDHYFE